MASEPLGKTIMSGPTKAQLDQIYRNTHSDYKGLSEDGVRMILVCRGGDLPCGLGRPDAGRGLEATSEIQGINIFRRTNGP